MAIEKNLEFENRSDSGDFQFNFVDVWRFLFSHRQILIVFTIVIPCLLSAYLFLVKRPVYPSQVVISLNSSSDTEGISARTFSFFAEEKETHNKMYTIERVFGSPAFQRLLYNEIASDSPKYEASDSLKEKKRILRQYFIKLGLDATEGEIGLPVKLFVDTDKYFFTVEAVTLDPVSSAALADLAAFVLVNYHHTSLLERVQSLKMFLEKQTDETQSTLKALEADLVKIRRQHRILSIVEYEAKSDAIQLDRQGKMSELKQKIVSADLMKAEIEREKLALGQSLAKGEQPSPVYLGQLQRRLNQLSAQIQTDFDRGSQGPADLAKVNKEYERILKAQNLFAVLNPWEYMKKLEEAQVDVNEKRLQALSELKSFEVTSAEVDRNFFDLPETLRKLSELKRNIQLTGELYQNLHSKLQEARIREAGTQKELYVIAPAEVPDAPAGMGRTAKLLLSILSGFFLGVTLLLFKFLLIPTVRGTGDMVQQGLVVVGSFPFFRPQPFSNQILFKAPDPFLVIKSDYPPTEKNALRYARFKLEKGLELAAFLDRKEGKILTVVSVNSGEGRSFLCANLAHAFSLSEFRVLIIDCDFGKFSLRKYFPDAFDSVAQKNGKSQVNSLWSKTEVMNNLEILEFRYKAEQAQSFLESVTFQDFLKGTRKDYDLILIDTPPLTGYLEPFIAAQKSDGVLFVVNERKTLRDSFYNGLRDLRQVHQGQVFAITNFSYDTVKLFPKVLDKVS